MLGISPRRTLLPLLLASACCACRVWAAPVELSVNAGEIRFDGTIISVDAAKRTLVMDVSSFTLPNGKSSKLATPKPKTIVLGAANKVLLQSDADRAVEWNELQPGTAVVAIGKDAGSGKDVPGRIVAVQLPAAGESTPEGEEEAADEKGAPIIRAGEVRYDGKVTGVLSATNFTLSVLASTNAAGQVMEYFEPQTKTVQLAADSLLRAREDVNRKMSITDLKIGMRVTLVGKDAGTKTVRAREVAVWDDSANKSRTLGTVTISHQAAVLLSRGDEARNGGGYEEALKFYSQGLRAAMDESDQAGQAMSYNRLAQMYDNLEQPKRALESYQKALEIWRRIGNASSEATTHLNLSGYYLRQDDVKNARQSVENAIRLYGTGNTRALAIAYSRLGSIQDEQDETEAAIASWQQALNLSRQVQERDEEIAVLGNLAVAYAETKQTERAQEAIEQLSALIPQINDKSDQAMVHYRLARSYEAVGQKTKAIDSLTQAKALWEALGQRDNATRAQNQLDRLNGKTPQTAAPAGGIEAG